MSAAIHPLSSRSVNAARNRALPLTALLAAAVTASGPAAAQSSPADPVRPSASATAVERIDPADIGIRLATAGDAGRVERWRCDRRRAEAAYWAALPEEPPVVGPPADREGRLR